MATRREQEVTPSDVDRNHGDMRGLPLSGVGHAERTARQQLPLNPDLTRIPPKESRPASPGVGQGGRNPTRGSIGPGRTAKRTGTDREAYPPYTGLARQ